MRHDIDRSLTVALAWLIFAVGCILPVVWIAAGEGDSPEAPGILASARERALLADTVVLGAGASAGALAAGLPLGLVLARCDGRRVQLARFGLIVPLVVPSYVITLSWVLMFEPTFGAWTYSLPAAIVVLAFSYYPIVMLTTDAVVRGVPARLEDAAQLLAAPWRVWARITVPLIAPVVLASAILVFVLAIADFAVPSMLRVRVYTTEVFTAFAALYDFRRAAHLALPIAGVGASAALAILWLAPQRIVARTAHGPVGRQWPPGMQRVVATLASAVSIGGVALVVAPVALQSLSGRMAALSGASAEAIANGIVWSGVAATLAVTVGAVLGYWRSRDHGWSGLVADMVWLALFATPATVAGVGLVSLWTQTTFVGDLYRTDAGIVAAYLARFLPVAALLCAFAFRRVPVAAEEAATVGGASWVRMFVRILLPMSRRSITAIWLITFILMFGDVSLSILVAPPGESNLAVRAYTLMANAPVADVARIALVQSLIALLPLSAIMILLRKPA